MRGDAADIHHLVHCSFPKVFLSGGLRDSHLRVLVGRPTPPSIPPFSHIVSVLSAASSLPVAAVQVNVDGGVAGGFFRLSVCRWR